MKTIKYIIKIFVFALLAIIFVASLFVILMSVQQKKNGYANIFGYTFNVVATDSMSPTIEVNDIIIAKIIDADTVIHVDDIITFKTTVNKQEILKTHRVTNIWEEGTFGTVYETWGDNREVCITADSGFRTQEDVVAVYVRKIDGAGKAINFLKEPKGYLILAVPIGIYILYEIFVLISIFMANKKEQILAETKDAKAAIIAEYLAQQKQNAESKENSTADSVQDGEKKE